MSTIHSVSDTSRMRSSEAVAVRNSFSFRTFMIRVMLVVMIVVGGKVAWGQTTYTWTAASGNLEKTAGTRTLNGKYWTQTSATYIGWDGNTGKGIQIGSGNNPTTSFSLTTTEFNSYTITRIVVNSSIANSGTAKLNISVDGTNYITNRTLTTTNAAYSCTPNTLCNNNIVVNWTNTAKAFYVKSIAITYTSGSSTYTVTYNPNGATSGTVPIDSRSYSSGDQVTVLGNTGNLAKLSHSFGGWNTMSNGSGTTYSEGNTFTISSNTILYAKWLPNNYTITWSVNGHETDQNYPIGASYTLTVPSSVADEIDDYDCNGKVFVGWTTHSDYYSRSEAPDDLTQTPSTTVTANVTYYAVFAIRDIARYEETLIQTLQYDTWSYEGSTTDKSSYRLFHTGSYIQSDPFDLSTLTKVIVYGGTFGGSIYNSITIGDGTNTWKNVTVSGSSQTGENVYTDGTALSGTGSLRIISNSGTATGTVSGIRISQVKIYVMAPVYAYSNFTTDCSHSDIYSVIYYANGATGDVPVDDNEYESGDNVIVLEPENLNVEGFHFYRWNTAADGSGTDYRVGDEIEVGSDNIRLYAIWKATITWLANGLSVESYQYNYGDYISEDTPADGDAEDYACFGKHFIGWSESPFEDNDDRPSIITRDQFVGIAVPGDKIYYAVYAETNPSDAPMNTNLWSESWDGGTDKTPSTYDFGGTTVYGGASLTYSQTGTTNIRSDLNYAGGTIPELFLQSGNKTWTISGIPTGGAYQMSFTFKSNKESFNLTGTTVGIDISGSGKNWTITNSGNVANFELTLTNTGGDNARIDDVELKVIQISAGATAYTTFCPCDYGTITGIDNGDVVWAGKNVEADWNDKDNWVVYNSSESKYHLAADVPATENNVFIVQKADCGITVSPNISENITCGNLTMFNGLSLAIAENKNLTINGTATFTSGIINGNVIFGSSATVNGVSRISHVDGIVTKSGAANGFTFPTGSNGNLGKVVVTGGTATNVSVQYFSNPDGFGANDLPRWWNAADMSGDNPFTHVSNVEYWRISSTEAITANFVAEASTDMHFNSRTDEEDKIPTNIQMAFYDNNRWTNVGGTASIDGNTLTINGAEIPASATRGISGNYTTFGSKSKNTVLPIELLSFTANCNGKSSLIEWTTATEKNNDFFVLERSNDAINFKEIARVAGAGNSIEPINYAYTDYGARSGDNYYRLVQVDYDGTSTASEIIVANCPAETSGEPDVLAFPNPFDDNLTLHFENFGNVQATVEVYDMLGRMVQTQKVNCSQNDYEVVLRLAGLSEGTYNVRISTKEFVLNKKVVKQ